MFPEYIDGWILIKQTMYFTAKTLWHGDRRAARKLRVFVPPQYFVDASHLVWGVDVTRSRRLPFSNVPCLHANALPLPQTLLAATILCGSNLVVTIV